MNKKGIALGDMPGVVMTLIIVAAFLVGGFLALEGLVSGSGCASGYTYNSASGLCELNSNTSVTDQPNNAGNATNTVITSLSNTTDQIDTVGTLIGVGLLLAVIGGAFVVGRRYM